MVDRAALRLAIVEDRPTTRAGLRALLAGERGVEAVAALPAAVELWALVRRVRPDAIVAGCAPGSAGGLRFCARVAALPGAPPLVAALERPTPGLVLAARLAGARGVAHVDRDAGALAACARRVAAGEVVLPRLRPDEVRAGAGALAPDDLPILAMALAGTPAAEIAPVVGATPRALARRVERMLAALCAP